MALIKFEFVLFGEMIDIESINSLLGVKATSFGYKGQPTPSGNTTNIDSFWEYSIDYVESHHVEDIISKELMPVFQNKVAVINAICKEQNLSAKIQFEIKISSGETPSLCLNKEFIRFLADIDAWIDFDMYVSSTK